MQKYAILHEKKKALEKLEKMYPLFEEKKEYKINAKKERDEYKRNLEEQIKNSGGNKELSDQE
jgi:hypothetical protein